MDLVSKKDFDEDNYDIIEKNPERICLKEAKEILEKLKLFFEESEDFVEEDFNCFNYLQTQLEKKQAKHQTQQKISDIFGTLMNCK